MLLLPHNGLSLWCYLSGAGLVTSTDRLHACMLKATAKNCDPWHACARLGTRFFYQYSELELACTIMVRGGIRHCEWQFCLQRER